MSKKWDGDEKRGELLSKIVEAADDIVAAILKDELASHSGKNLDEEQEDHKKVMELKKRMKGRANSGCSGTQGRGSSRRGRL